LDRSKDLHEGRVSFSRDIRSEWTGGAARGGDSCGMDIDPVASYLVGRRLVSVAR